MTTTYAPVTAPVDPTDPARIATLALLALGRTDQEWHDINVMANVKAFQDAD